MYYKEVFDEAGNCTLVGTVDVSEVTWESKGRRVAVDYPGDLHVSTVFLVMDHGFGLGPPILYETMIFGPGSFDFRWRYETRAEAKFYHAYIIEQLEAGKTPAEIDDMWRPKYTPSEVKSKSAILPFMTVEIDG